MVNTSSTVHGQHNKLHSAWSTQQALHHGQHKKLHGQWSTQQAPQYKVNTTSTTEYGQLNKLYRKKSSYWAKFERPPLHSVCQSAKIEAFVKTENTSIISLEYVKSEK